jgi:uncharacterized membrane protein YhfC
MGIEITVINIIGFVILTCVFVGLEYFIKRKTKLNEILKTIPAAMFFSAILIIVWQVLDGS